MQDVTNLKVWKWRNNRMRVKMRCECIEFLQSSQKKVVTFRPSRNWYIYLLFFFYRTRIHHKWIILSSIVSLTFFFVCDDQIVRTLHTIMSKVIIVDIQPQFKVGHVNVNRFTRVMTNGPRFNPFPRVGGPFVIIEGSRFDSPFLPFVNMINAPAIGKYHSKKGNDHGLWLFVDAVFY